MYCGVGDVGGLRKDRGYFDGLRGLWDKVVRKKLYMRGGMGWRGEGEGLGGNYELENDRGYCESCGGIGNV